jgi:uncharacterized protein (DUF1499 family)
MARAGMWLAVAAAALFILGPGLAHFEIASPLRGFVVFALSIPLALVGGILAVAALVRGPAGSRPTASRGLILSAVVLAAVISIAAPSGKFPRINDITTDTENPPRFVRAGSLPENAGRDLAYPGEEFARQQREGYGNIPPLNIGLSPDETYARVRRMAAEMPGWTITTERTEDRAVEGFDTTRTFRFKDDFVIEVREADGVGVVHMRSKSRDGRGDMGANASRIQSFFFKLAQSGG